ncbi:4241_t:CDS:2 [Acaulospora colombiana]|uniref:4241_t:CDS:1 n=1 Tax=Acaulospora colombiana TaxID=27376 RepID=A0ACA9NI96_9GLOM|nr:4241_t:CDS:2 [Acaulospora colombiana]
MAEFALPPQSFTPYPLTQIPLKDTITNAFTGKSVLSVRTPAVFIDRAIFSRNCAKMQETVKSWGTRFRAHVKSHKTTEGARLQLQSTAGQSSAVIVSTLMEAKQIIESGLVKEGVVDDILYGLPVAPTKIADIAEMSSTMAQLNSKAKFRLLVDNVQQVKALAAFGNNITWSIFIKVDHGGKRAGLPIGSESLKDLIQLVLSTPSISLFGFYCHAGDSYASTSFQEASSFLTTEMQTVNAAGLLALSLMKDLGNTSRHQNPLVLSVGSTPTAHSASLIESPADALRAAVTGGELEIHAGNYPLCDLQQIHTGLVEPKDVSHRVLASVISYYPGRGENGTDEALCDAGGISMSKDRGPSGGFGDVVPWDVDDTIGKRETDGSVTCEWRLGRCSQEHGILVKKRTGSSQGNEACLNPGDHVWIIGQHACLTLAAHPWYYILDSSIQGGMDTIQDIWVSWKGW